MFKAKIKNKQNILTHEFIRPTLEEINLLLDDSEINISFGKPQRQLTEQQALLEGLDLNEAIAIEDIEAMGQMVTYYTFEAEYTIEIEDITAQVQAEQLKIKSMKAIQYGLNIMAEIRALNESKVLNAAQFEVLINDVNLERIERLIYNGSFKTAKALIMAYSGLGFTEADKIKILTLVDQAILDCG